MFFLVKSLKTTIEKSKSKTIFIKNKKMVDYLFKNGFLFACFLLFHNCQTRSNVNIPSPPPISPEKLTTAHELSVQKTYDYFFDPLLADGFDFPIGNKDGKGSYTSPEGKTYYGWYIATHTAEEYSLGIHTGEDWNGNGGSNTDLGQPVYATAKGVVIAAGDYGYPWGNVVLVKHYFLENGALQMVFSLYGHLDEFFLKKGDLVERRQKLGTIGTGGDAYPAHLHFEIRKSSMADYAADYWPSSNGKDVAWVLKNYEKPSDFIKKYRAIPLPINEAHFLIAFKKNYALYYFQKGKLFKTYEIALSQNPIGHKEKQGDNRLPEGEYRLIQKSRGPFGGNVAAYFGTAWIRLNYPNNFDAEAGYTDGKITKAERNAIIRANNAGKEPNKHTALGSGIGIHGWNGEWKADGIQNLTWGCISMHNSDLDTFYDLIPLQTKIVIVGESNELVNINSGFKNNLFYKVNVGDTLFSIAQRYGTTVADLKKANGLGSNTIKVGEELVIPNKVVK